jgi:hypothetical protein
MQVCSQKTDLNHEVNGDIGGDGLGSATLGNGRDVFHGLGGLAALGESGKDLHLTVE